MSKTLRDDDETLVAALRMLWAVFWMDPAGHSPENVIRPSEYETSMSSSWSQTMSGAERVTSGRRRTSASR